LAHPFGRHGPGDDPKADMVAQTDASRKKHRPLLPSRITRQTGYIRGAPK
jgi:hypothetical protein